ncbi:MAG: hypothetical protein HRU24_07255 [Gammaproteobacteria bacterium]|nr:hypothetical protein [Gammaproteobacteria bacterium]
MIKNLISLLLQTFVTLSLTLALSVGAVANQIEQLDADELDFLLLDYLVQKQRISLAVEAFQYQEHTLLPINGLLSALGAGVVIDPKSGNVRYQHNGKTIEFNLNDFNQIKALTKLSGTIYWTRDDYEIYVSHFLLEQLIDGQLRVNLSDLTLKIKSNSTPFPIEKQWLRNDKLRLTAQQQDVKQLYLPDVYQLLTPPTANINLFGNAQQQTTNQGDGTDYNAGYSIQSISDVLYHSAHLSLLQDTNNSNVVARLNFSRHQASPDQSLFGGLRKYSFGDISVASNSLLNNISNGVGITGSRRPAHYNREFGKKTIEGDATPGWEVELYRNGFLLKQGVVPSNGHYIFSDLTSDYGVNNFEVRLFGPYGEELIRQHNINIGHNWLAQGDYGYDFYLIKPNKRLFNNQKSTLGNQNDYGFSFDYSLFESTQIGGFFQRYQNNINSQRKYIGTHIESSFNNLQLDFSTTHQLEHGYTSKLRGLGRLPWGNTYDFKIETNNNFSRSNIPTDTNNYFASFGTGGAIRLARGMSYRANISHAGNQNGDKIWGFSPTISGRLASVNFGNTFNYQNLKASKSTDSTNFLSGSFNLSSQIDALRLSGSASYNLYPISQLNNLNANLSWRGGPKSHHYINTNFQPANKRLKKDNWQFSYTYSTYFKSFQLNLSSSLDANHNWAVNFGVSFFLDYDAHNQRFLIDSTTSSASGNLNVHSYLDRNSNGQLDEADWALSGVKFSPLSIWRNLKTNQLGKVSLPGIPVNQPFTFSALSIEGIETKQQDYTIYTHPGSRIDIDIVFEVVTHISGFVMMADPSGNRAVTVGTILLTNTDTQEHQSVYLDIDGFFEFNQLASGTYTLEVSPKDLERLQLVPAKGVLSFSTPSKGGFFELKPIVLITAQNSLPNQTNIQLNSDNGEPYYFGDQLNNNNLYARPTTNNNVNKQKSFEPNMPEDSTFDTTTSIGENIKQLNKAVSPELSAIAGAVKYYYTLQMGAYSQMNNAEGWIDNHPKIANCRITTRASFHIVNCGYYDSMKQAQEQTTIINNTTPKLAPFIKKIESKILSQNSYTIQLLVASKNRTLEQFIEQHNLIRSELTITSKDTDGVMLMFVTQGNFTTKILAQAKLATYDAPLQRTAWIKHIDLP